MTHQKRLSAPKHYPIRRKDNTYVSTIEGSRSPENAIPVNVFLRDVTEYADTDKEAKQIVRNGQVLRNGDRIRSEKQGIGILDVVQLPEAEESFRVLREGNDLKFMPTGDERKAAKIVEKRMQDDEYVYQLHSGENYRSGEEYSTESTLIFDDDVEEVELEEGAQVVVISGRHAGEVAELKEINERGMNPDTGRVSNGDEFETELENLVAVGDLEVEE